jgi:hypothetical protein
MATQVVNTYDVGQEVRFSVTFAVDSTPTDPTAIIFRTQDPSGNTTTYTFGVGVVIVKDDTGDYHADIILDEEGGWYYRWEGTGAVDAAKEFYCEVRDSMFTP